MPSPHGHRLGHPRGKCPVGCLHRLWLESYDDARRIAELERESVTGNWRGDLEIYKETAPPMPTLKQWMMRR